MRNVIVSTAIALLLVSGAGLARASTASAAAALPSCNGFGFVVDGFGNDVQIPEVAGNASAGCVLGVGNNGTAVQVLQGHLDLCYGANIAQDGAFGPQTRAALQAAQRREGVTADGIYGPQTRDALHWQEWLQPDGRCVRITI